VTYETVEVPFVTIGNHQAITRKQAAEMLWLVDFVSRFPACFEYDINHELWVYYPDGVRNNGYRK